MKQLNLIAATTLAAAACAGLWAGGLGATGQPAAGGGAPAVTAAADPNAAARAEIMKTAQGFVEAFEKGDAAAAAAFWTEDGDYTDLGGRTLRGRKAIQEDFAEVFGLAKGMKLRIDVHRLRFPTPDTAIEDGVTSVMSPDGTPPNRAKYTNFLVKSNGKWLLSSVRESHYRPPSHYEFLRPLEWVIGEWAEDGKEDHVSRIKFEWTHDQNFIMASRAVVVKGILLNNGSQRIGWDPAARMVRSWNFEDDGGFGQGAWTRDGDKWTIQMSSVLQSGNILTGKTTVTRVDPETITWQVTEQRMDGKPMPDGPVVKMKRIG